MSPEAVLHQLGSLIIKVKEKSSDMIIYVCQIVPVLIYQEVQAKIGDYSEHLVKQGETNGVTIVKTSPVFTLGAGEVPLTPNRLGVIKLLNITEKQY